MDKLVNILALITLLEMMIFIGLSATIADVLSSMKNIRLIALAMLANYLVVPLITVGLLLGFAAKPMVSVGFLILAVCPGGPYGAPFTVIARGNVSVAAGLMVILASVSPVLSPVLLRLLAPLVAGNQSIHVDMGKIIVTLLFGQALPLVAGLLLRHRRPHLADRMLPAARQLSKLLNLIFLLLLLYVQFDSLLQIRLRGLLGMMILLMSSLLVGWLAGGPGRPSRKAMAMTTAVRNNGVAIVIATASFPGTPAVTATVIYGVVALLGTLATAIALNKQSSP
jgi:bile acid:Na+ symporter, BASS family